MRYAIVVVAQWDAEDAWTTIGRKHLAVPGLVASHAYPVERYPVEEVCDVSLVGGAGWPDDALWKSQRTAYTSCLALAP